MNETRTEKKRNRAAFWILLLIVALLATVFVLAPVGAKYLTQRSNPENAIRAYNFYLTSDYLEEGTAPVINVNAGTTTLPIKLYNYDDQLRVSDLEINYTAAITAVKDKNGATVTNTNHGASLEDATGTIAAGPGKASATVTLNGLKDGYSYTVTATGTNGFTKTISATFTVAAEESGAYKYLLPTADDNNEYVELTVWTEGSTQGALSITYPSGLIPDNTDPAMSGWATGGTGSGSMGLYESHTFRFFGNPSGITAENFTVTVGDTTATAKNPQS